MAKRIEIDGKFYRKRRGKLVEIPEEWVGKITRPQTIRKRQSKMTRKNKNRGMKKWKLNPWFHDDYIRRKRGEDIYEDKDITAW